MRLFKMTNLFSFENPQFIKDEEITLNYSNFKVDYHFIQIMEYACKAILMNDYLESFERIEAHLNAAKERYNRMEKDGMS